MFGLFDNNKSPEERLETCLKKKDWDGVARAYYDLGTAAMDHGDFNSAVLWLSRADTVYSASDGVYKKASKNRLFHKEIVTDCSNRIGALEEEDLLYNNIPMEIEEKAAELGDIQIRILELLAMARLVKLGEMLSRLPGCEVLGRLGQAADIMLKSFQEPITQEEYGQLMDICNGLYEFGDSPAFYGGGEIEVPGSAPFQVFDLNGMMGVHLELNGCIDNHLRFLSALSQGEETPEADIYMAGCTLLPDYYVRTGAKHPEQLPPVRAELKRIWDDFDFVCSHISWEKVAERVKEYLALDLLKDV